MGAQRGFKKGLASNPTGSGGFEKGKSGNPSGRSKEAREAAAHISELAKKHTPEALATIVEIMKLGEKEANRLAAALAILDRAYGRPAQSVDASLELTGPITVIVKEE